MADDTKIEKHPSYAMLQISRVSGQATLFGSHVQHQHFIELRIQPGERHSSLGADHYYSPLRPYIVVQMSAAQFAEAITSLNMGSGVPCTLRHLEGKGQIDRPPREAAESQRTKEHVQLKADEAKKRIEEDMGTLGEILAKPAIGKKDRETIMKLIEQMSWRFKEAIPFYVDQFTEATERVHAKAVTEFEALIAAKFQNLGLETAKALGITAPDVKQIEGDK